MRGVSLDFQDIIPLGESSTTLLVPSAGLCDIIKTLCGVRKYCLSLLLYQDNKHIYININLFQRYHHQPLLCKPHRRHLHINRREPNLVSQVNPVNLEALFAVSYKQENKAHQALHPNPQIPQTQAQPQSLKPVSQISLSLSEMSSSHWNKDCS